MIDFLESINPFIWAVTSALIAYNTLALVAFVSIYTVLFDPESSISGRFIRRLVLAVSMVVAVAFTVTVVDYDGDTNWFGYSPDPLVIRPLFRLFAYSYVAYAITSLLILMRRVYKDEKYLDK